MTKSMAKNRRVKKLCADGLSRKGELKWTLSKGCLVIGGEGVMRDFTEKEPAPWMEKREQIRQLTVEAGVENIGGRAFIGCEALVSVTFGPDVRRIGWHAFRDCTRLEQVNTGRKLQHWRLPAPQEPVTLVGHRAFFGTPWQARQAGGLLIHEDTVLDYFGGEECVVIPKGIRHIAPMAFERLPIKSVTFPTSLETVGACAFYDADLEKVLLSRKLRLVENFAFGGNSRLEQVWLGNRKAQIHPKAFAGTPVEEIEASRYGPWLIAWKDNMVSQTLFVELEPKKWSAVHLKQLMRDGAVLLRVIPWQDEMDISITSCCYDYRGDMMWYKPYLCLCEEGICGDRTVMVETAEQWRSRYEAEDTWLSLDSEEMDYIECAEELEQLYLLMRNTKKHGGKLYFSWDRENFYGPLELELGRKWLDENPQYHVGVIRAA